MRKCSSCQQVKPVSDFHTAGRVRKINYECKMCHSARKARRYEERKALGVTTSESRCTACGEVKSASEFRNNWHRASGLDTRCHDCVSHGNRKLHFDLTPEQYAAKLVEQGGVCAICGQPELSRAKNGRIKALAVDHDHTTGAVRGLLCANCNKGIGNLGDSADRLIAAARYLLEYSDAGGDEPPAGDPQGLLNKEVI